MPAQDELGIFAERLEATAAPYMITGATAAILYGQPRVTNDLDLVLQLDDRTRRPCCVHSRKTTFTFRRSR